MKVPSKPKGPCSYPGCPNLCYGRYCEEHRRKAEKQYDRFERPIDVNKKYGRAWKKIRDKYVQEHPLCEKCLEEGKYVPVQEVHHILPVKQGGTNSKNNLMSLCRSCHNKIHSNEIGDR